MGKIITPPFFESVVNEGEQRLLKFLKTKLPDTYFLIPNVELAATNPRNNKTQFWEYDLIVVSPHAVYNIENKDWKGRIEGDEYYWYLNDRPKPNPLKNGKAKTDILANKLRGNNPNWKGIWVQNLVTLSYPNSYQPMLSDETRKLTFTLNNFLLKYLQDPAMVGKIQNSITTIQTDIVKFLTGGQSKKKPKEIKELQGYSVLKILVQEQNYTEYLVQAKGIESAPHKRIKEYTLQVANLNLDELKNRENQITNQYKALNKIKVKPFILNVEFRIDEENHCFYEILDLLEENSLRSEIRRKTFTFEEKVSIIKNIASALKEAHKENIFHRDVNPDNIYLSGGYAFLGNFGKSYFIDHENSGYSVMSTINEMNASAYHPLELISGYAKQTSDIYSLGILTYWLFNGNEPIKNPHELDRMGGSLPENKLPSVINPALPEWFDEFCNQTIQIDPSKRFPTMDELLRFLEKSLKEEETKQQESHSKANKKSDSLEFKEGDKVTDYTIYKILGKGGYSQVYKVKHSLQGKDYALKVLFESVNANSVIDEYQSLKSLDHPNIVKFVWNGTLPSGQFFTVMELLEGDNLSNYVQSDLRLPLHRVYSLGKDILSALVAMQSMEKPLLHRDIKPQNIIWDKEKRFVLIDFNVASFIEDNKDFVGTNPYLAPDLIKDNYKVDWDLSADTFSLGIAMYELLFKQHPWQPGSKIPSISIPPKHPKDLSPKLSKDFSDFIWKAIQPKKENRFFTAEEMFNALLVIGENNLFTVEINKQEKILVHSIDNESYNIVNYINTLYSQSKYGNKGTRAKKTLDVYDEITYTPTQLDNSLIPAILDGKFKLVIITGNAGDGKTAFIKKIETLLKIKDANYHAEQNGASFLINKIPFRSNYDGSQDEGDKVNTEVLESFFKPFESVEDYNSVKEGRIIAINEGRLVEFFMTSTKHKKLARITENFFTEEGKSNLPEGIAIINLNMRSVVANVNGESLFRKQIKSLTAKELWNQCKSCKHSQYCFINYNVETFNDTAVGNEIINRMEWFLRTVNLKRELHVTMRDLRSFLAFLLTRDHSCKDVEELLNKASAGTLDYWQYFYFNISNPHLQDSGNQDRLIKLMRETDIGEVAVPDLDRDLFFLKHSESDFFEFEERQLSLIKVFNVHKHSYTADDAIPDQDQRIRETQKLYIRHQYFEGKIDLKKRLPYISIQEFYNLLVPQDKDKKEMQARIIDDKVESISKAISLNEGCDNSSVDKKNLVLGSSETKDPKSKSFRLFPLTDFELFVNRVEEYTNYIEYEPDSLIFRHKNQKHIRMLISLDLYEILYYVNQGFSPSLNDLRGKFVELIIFKNLLENLNYNEVIVTPDNISFYSISKDHNNILYVKSMEEVV